MKKIWLFLNSPLFDFVGGLVICMATVWYFLVYANISIDPMSCIFAALLVIGFDCMTDGGHRLFSKKAM